MRDILYAIIGGLVGLFIGLGTLSVAFAYDVFSAGIVLHVLWGWFVVSTFHVAVLPIVAGAGIAMMVHYLTYSLRGPQDKCGVKPVVTAKQSLGHLAVVLLRPWLVLALAFILHLFL